MSLRGGSYEDIVDRVLSGKERVKIAIRKGRALSESMKTWIAF